MASTAETKSDGLGKDIQAATSNLVDDAKHKLSDSADGVKHQLGDMVSSIQDQAKSTIGDGKGQVASQVRGIANAFNKAGEQLGAEDQTQLAQYSGALGDQVEHVASYLEDKDVGDILGDIERFARRQPAIFLGGALVVGLVAARFLRSSSHSQTGR